MPNSSTDTHLRPWVPPNHPPLSGYIEWLWASRGPDIEFIVLFGSRARGDAVEGSDYDILVGLRTQDGLRLTDRIGLLQDELTGKVQVLPYPVAEVRRMLDDRNGLVLNALADGIPLYDHGAWGSLVADFRACQDRGMIRRFPGGWDVCG